MKRVPYGKYSKELREEAVRLMTQEGYSLAKASDHLQIPRSTLESWRRLHKQGKLNSIGKERKPLTEVEQELARVKRELTKTKMERDILKKAAAYFAKASL